MRRWSIHPGTSSNYPPPPLLREQCPRQSNSGCCFRSFRSHLLLLPLRNTPRCQGNGRCCFRQILELWCCSCGGGGGGLDCIHPEQCHSRVGAKAFQVPDAAALGHIGVRFSSFTCTSLCRAWPLCVHDEVQVRSVRIVWPQCVPLDPDAVENAAPSVPGRRALHLGPRRGRGWSGVSRTDPRTIGRFVRWFCPCGRASTQKRVSRPWWSGGGSPPGLFLPTQHPKWGGGGGTVPHPPFSDWAKFFSGPKSFPRRL